MNASRQKRTPVPTRLPTVLDETLVLNAYETLAVLAGDLASVSGDAALTEHLGLVKRALLTPNGTASKTLMRAIARFEAVNNPVPGDPDLRK